MGSNLFEPVHKGSSHALLTLTEIEILTIHSDSLTGRTKHRTAVTKYAPVLFSKSVGAQRELFLRTFRINETPELLEQLISQELLQMLATGATSQRQGRYSTA